MKKLLYLINSFNTGGAEKAMLRICSNIDKRRYDITVLALHKGDETLIPDLESNNIDYKSFGIKGYSKIPGLYKLFRYLQQNQDATLVTSLFRSNLWGRLLGRLAGVKKTISWQHNRHDMNHWLKRHLLSLTNPLTDLVLADSNATRDYYEEKSYTAPTVRTLNISAVETGSFYSHNPGEKPVVASVGRLKYVKGFDILLRIAQRVLEHDGVVFKIAGDGEERDELEQLAETLGIHERVKFEGFVKDIPEFLADADIYVQTSRSEGSCIAVVEAMAASLPVVAFDVGGINEAVREGENGYIIPEGDIEVFSQRLLELVNSPERRKKFSRQSRELAEQNHEIDDLVKRFTSLI